MHVNDGCLSKRRYLTIYSAQDSTLMGLLCAFKLEHRALWPEYGSFLMVELLECDGVEYVRFSLNGELLNLQWSGDSVEMMQFDDLSQRVRNEGEATKGTSFFDALC